MKSNEAAKKTASTDHKNVVRLTRIKQWYIPADAESYLKLRAEGVALTRFHQDFLPTLKLLTEPKGITLLGSNFKDKILEPFLDRVGRSWKNKEHCDCTIGAKSMDFESVKTEGFAIAKATIPKLQQVLTDFFARWGYRHTFTYSELRGKCKLTVDYWFDPERQPIVILEAEPETLPKIQWRLGNLRFTFTFEDPKGRVEILRNKNGMIDENPMKKAHIGYIHTTVEISQGGTFTPLHTSRCTYDQLSTVKPLIKALMDIPNHAPNNFEQEPD